MTVSTYIFTIKNRVLPKTWIILAVGVLAFASSSAWADKKCDSAIADWEKAESKQDAVTKELDAADKALVKALNDGNEKEAKKASKKSQEVRKKYLKEIETMNKAQDKVKSNCDKECDKTMEETKALFIKVDKILGDMGKMLVLMENERNDDVLKKMKEQWSASMSLVNKIETDIDNSQIKSVKICKEG